jgi:hypothetical protein
VKKRQRRWKGVQAGALKDELSGNGEEFRPASSRCTKQTSHALHHARSGVIMGQERTSAPSGEPFSSTEAQYGERALRPDGAVIELGTGSLCCVFYHQGAPLRRESLHPAEVDRMAIEVHDDHGRRALTQRVMKLRQIRRQGPRIQIV